MSVFKSNLKLNVKKVVQYRAAAFSGVLTQLFFGFMYIALYTAFLKTGKTDFTLREMISYVWLGQVFFVAFNYFDTCKQEISRRIMNGDYAYELIRPISLYENWFQIVYSKPLGHLLVRGVPVIIISLLLPCGLGLMLPPSFECFILFIISTIISSLLIASISMISYIITLYTLSSAGVFAFMVAIGNLLSGGIIPIPMMPKSVQAVLNFFPFRYVSDLPYRLYIGNINGNDALFQICIQIAWTIGLIVIGKLIMNRKLKKLVVQGG